MPTFKFPVTPELVELLSRPNVVLVHDDGIYLHGSAVGDKVQTIVRPANGNQGMGPGYGDDWVEQLGAIKVPEGANMFEIKLTKNNMEMVFYAPSNKAPSGGHKPLQPNLPTSEWLEGVIAMLERAKRPTTDFARLLSNHKEQKMLQKVYDEVHGCVHKVQVIPDQFYYNEAKQMVLKLSGLTQTQRNKLKALGYGPASAKGVWFKVI